MKNNIYDDIPELNVRPYNLDRLRETGSCTANIERQYGDVRFVQPDAVWNIFSHAPKEKEVIIYCTTRGVMKDGLKQAFAPELKDWATFCIQNCVDYWAYRDNVLPQHIR